MSKYKVMLVDDEKDVMDMICARIDWNACGLDSPVYAANGLEALELAEQVHPDIVMTDIKMPYMDGLELSRQLKQLYPNIRIIILSGFDEFEYAKEAVSLNAEEYLLKP
ncbi:MAG: response regulator, partial [Erysipelotrichaceae bacterium]|nr:response regulator [Erysipelotrichaceae bacterium]